MLIKLSVPQKETPGAWGEKKGSSRKKMRVEWGCVKMTDMRYAHV